MSNRTLIVIAVLTFIVVSNVFYMEVINVKDSHVLSSTEAVPVSLEEFRNSNKLRMRHLPAADTAAGAADDEAGAATDEAERDERPNRADDPPEASARGKVLPVIQKPVPPQHRVAGLSCKAFEDQGALADESISEMVYWRDIPSDASFTSPFAQAGPTEKYLTFESDEGGWNNIRMAMETAVLMAILMGRTLVMPPQQSFYLLWDGGDHKKQKQKKHFGFEDFFHFDSVTAEHVGLKVISFEGFLKNVAMTGQLRDPETGQPSFPPENRTDWNGIVSNYESTRTGHGKVLWNWVRRVIPPLNWIPERCVAAFGSEPGQGAVDRVNSTLFEVRKRLAEMPNPDGRGDDLKWRLRVDGYDGHPTAVDASTADRLAELLADRDALCIYNVALQQQQVLHVRGGETARLLVPFYAFLFPEDWRHDLWMKRFVRDHLRYQDEIQCAAARVVQAVREIARRNAAAQNSENDRQGNGSYDSMHIRRGDFQYTEMKIPAEEMYAENTAHFLQDGRTVFIATDERNRSWFQPLADHYHLLFLSDFEHLLTGLNTNYYGMVDQLVASRGEVFVGTYFSTFTGYINRVRGYHAQVSHAKGYQEGFINSYHYAPKTRPDLPHLMRSYKAVVQGFWQQEFPVSWRDIDHNVEENQEQDANVKAVRV